MNIESIKASERIKGRFLVTLDNGEVLRVGEGEMISFSLYAGMEITAAQLNALQAGARESKLKERAIALVSGKPMSRGELIEKLTRPPLKKGEMKPAEEELAWRKTAAESIADRLEELGLLNDEEYAKAVVKHYSRKGFGVRRLRDELYRRKVPRDFWEDALLEAQPPEDGVDAFICKRLDGLEEPDQKDMQRVSNALARKGFGWEEIKDGIERWKRARE